MYTSRPWEHMKIIRLGYNTSYWPCVLFQSLYNIYKERLTPKVKGCTKDRQQNCSPGRVESTSAIRLEFVKERMNCRTVELRNEPCWEGRGEGQGVLNSYWNDPSNENHTDSPLFYSYKAPSVVSQLPADRNLAKKVFIQWISKYWWVLTKLHHLITSLILEIAKTKVCEDWTNCSRISHNGTTNITQVLAPFALPFLSKHRLMKSLFCKEIMHALKNFTSIGNCSHLSKVRH